MIYADPEIMLQNMRVLASLNLSCWNLIFFYHNQRFVTPLHCLLINLISRSTSIVKDMVFSLLKFKNFKIVVEFTNFFKRIHKFRKYISWNHMFLVIVNCNLWFFKLRFNNRINTRIKISFTLSLTARIKQVPAQALL